MDSRSAPGEDARARRAVFWLAGLFLLCLVYFPAWGGDWNQNAHLDLTLALVNHGSVSIDPYHWNTGDEVYSAGHYHIDKAPGMSLAGVPIFLLYRQVMTLAGQGSMVQSLGLKRTWNRDFYHFVQLQYIEALFTVALPAVLLLLLFFWYLGTISSSLLNRGALTLAFALATGIFPYSQVYYSHVPAALCELAGFVVLQVLHRGIARGRGTSWIMEHPRPATAFAGFLVAMAVLFEYPAAVVSAILGLYALVTLPRRLWLFLAAGIAPPMCALLAYNFAAYHNPLVTGYSVPSRVWTDQGRGIGGSSFFWPPRPEALYGLSVSPYRGMFFLSPFLLLALPGYALWLRRDRGTALLFLAVPAALFVVVSMYAYWYAGSSVGPRYLIAALPFLAIPVIFTLDRWQSTPARAGIGVLILLSAANVWVQTISGGGYPPAEVHNPLLQYSLPALVHGDVNLSLGTVLLWPVVGLHSTLTLLPLADLVAGWTLFCWQSSRRAATAPAPAVPPV